MQAMASINVRALGPLVIAGPVTITDPTGVEYVLEEGKSATFCRCGMSGNKPFCDATHKQHGWDQPDPIDPERLPNGVTAT